MTIKTHDYSVARNTSYGRAPISFIVMHYTATNGATAKNEVDYFGTNPAAVNASADFFVDDNNIFQYNTQLESRYSWAVGDGSGGSFGNRCNNTNQISIEMCCYESGGNWFIGERTYKNAVDLVRYLMKKYNVSSDRVIRHYDVSLKHCPNVSGWIPPLGESVWKKFKSDIGEKISVVPTAAVIYRVRKSADDAKSQIGAYKNLQSAKKLAEKNKGYSVFDTSGRTVYSPHTATRKKSVDEIAREVISGKWGNGDDRKRRITEAGYDYSAVQAAVNALMR